MDNYHNKSIAETVEQLLDNEQVEAALALLSDIPGNDAELFYLRGRAKWKLGLKTDAMSDYSRAAAIDPSSKAAEALTMAREIMDFYNHDLYNP